MPDLENMFDTLAIEPATQQPAVTFQIPDKSTKHAQAWGKIFKKLDWLEKARSVNANPVLIGRDVPALYENRDEPVYLILLSMDWSYYIAEEGKQSLEECLHDFDRCEGNLGEVRLRGTNITINIHDSVEGHADYTAVSDLHQVFRDNFATEVLYYTGADEPVKLHPENRKHSVVTISFSNGFPDNYTQGTTQSFLLTFSLCIYGSEAISWAICEDAPANTYYPYVKDGMIILELVGR